VTQRYDVLVIGSGAGGAPLATLLAEHGRKVLIVEAGGPVTPTNAADAVDRYYLMGGMTLASGNGAFVSVLAGEALGGTTAINSGTCLRPPAEVLREWDARAGTNLAGELPEHVEEVERDVGVGVPPLELLGPSHHLFLRGVQSMDVGEPFVLPRNAKSCVGSGMCCFGCPTGAKQSTDRAYLPRAKRAGAEIVAHTRAETIVPERDGVRVTLAKNDGRREEVRAREVVIAGGALSTPRLLRGSKLGREWRRAGEELTIHPATKVVAVFPHPVHGERGVPQGMGMDVKGLPNLKLEGIFTPPEALIPLLAGGGVDLPWWLDRHDRIASFGMMVRDESRGQVRWRMGMPVIRYALTSGDAASLVEGMKIVGRAYFRAGAERVFLPFMGPGNVVENEASLMRLDARSIAPQRILATGFHPLGTAGLGRVVDDELRLVGEPRIRVCDGSVLPGPPGVNPQITIMAMAHRLAARMIGERAAS
jgi:choline dehydrogenase-like flavoprotein